VKDRNLLLFDDVDEMNWSLHAEVFGKIK